MAKKRENRTVIMHLGNKKEEYEKIIANKDLFLEKVEYADSIDWGCFEDKHKPDCTRMHRFTRHGHYQDTLKSFNGESYQIEIWQVRCLDCGAVFTIKPSFAPRYKRYDTDCIEKLIVIVFIAISSYRGADLIYRLASDEIGEGVWKAIQRSKEVPSHISPRVVWRLVMWLGSIHPAFILIALGIDPPKYVVSDEKFTTENGDRRFTPAIIESDSYLIWWVDHIDKVDETTLRESFERFKSIHPSLRSIEGVTLDGWNATKNALKGTFDNIKIQLCQLHPQIKLSKDLASLRKNKDKKIDENEIRKSFRDVLNAKDKDEFLAKSNQLPDIFDTDLLKFKKSLQSKIALFTSFMEDENLQTTTVVIDQIFKFLDRKLFLMGTLRTDDSAKRTLNAFATTRNFWRFYPGAKNESTSPVELAGVDLDDIPWMQWVCLIMTLLFLLKHKFWRLCETLLFTEI